MTSWNQTANSIFLEAIEITDPAQQSSFLDKACAGMEDVKREVIELLAAHRVSDGFLEEGAGNTFSSGFDFSIRIQQADFPAGTHFGRYRLDRTLGHGGMAVVYLATDTRLNRKVAIKVPKKEWHHDAELRLEREARMMASVKHPNLASVIDIDQWNGVKFLLSEYISGVSLSDALSTGEPMSPQEVAAVMVKLSDATACAHRAGVVHRDIKPSNVIISDSNEPILLDFGLAYFDCDDARLTRSGVIIGTPAYMAPEQLHGALHLIGPHCDIYALGAICYEMITGKTVYAGSASQVLEALANDDRVPPPVELNSTADPYLSAICMKAIARQPENRFATSDELAGAFRNYLLGEYDGLRTLLPAEAKPVSNRVQRIAVWVALCAIGLVTIVLYSTIFRENTLSKTDPKIDLSNALEMEAWSEPTRVPFFGGEFYASNASLTRDALRIVFVLHKQGGNQLCESSRDTLDAPFSIPRPIDNLVFESNQKNIGDFFGNPWLSADGLDMILYVREPLGNRGTDLWHTYRDSVRHEWKPIRSLGSDVNSLGAEYSGSLSEDKLTLVFFRPNPANSYDGEMWIAHRSHSADEFQDSRLLANGVNTSASEQHPYVARGGLALFFDRGTPDPRLWIATRQTVQEDFGNATALSLPDTWKDRNAYAPSLTADGETLVFTSNRVSGKEGFETAELWQCKRKPK